MAISSNVSEFLGKIQSGVKPNMFLVDLQFPANHPDNPQGDEKDLVDLLCKSAGIPAANMGVVEVPFRGRVVKIAGDRTFDNWSVTFINDRDMKIRSFMERWLETLNSHEGNVSDLFLPNNGSGYTANLKVKQLERDGNVNGTVIREYTFKDAFPTSVSQIDLAYDANDQIEDFTVDFQYQYWEVLSNGDGTSNKTLPVEG